MSADFLPLTQVVNNTNSAIPLTEIFARVFSDVCNSLGFEVQKKKNGDRGTIVFTATLSPWGLLWFGSDFQKINWRSQEVLNLDQSEPNFDFDFF